MNKEQIEKELSEYIVALTGVDIDITSDTTLSDMNVDSISLVKIFVFIERHFGVSLLDVGLNREQIETLGCFAGYIQEQL